MTEDNENGVATGWLPGRLSQTGCELARELGRRRCDGTIDAVFTSDLERAVETTNLAFGESGLPIFHDWRLRECNYGELNGMPVEKHFAIRSSHTVEPYPGGESWQEAIQRVDWFLDDLRMKWSGCRVVVIGHTATRWAFDHYLTGKRLETLLESDFDWQEGWEYFT